MRTSLFVAVAVMVGCGSEPPVEPELLAPRGAVAKVSEDHDVNPRVLRRFKPLRRVIPAAPGAEAAKVALGRMLFFDTRLSKDGDLSCNSCHRLDKYGVDHEPTSIGAKGQRGRRNSPTVYHAAWHFTSFWDGRARDVEEQAKGPILNPAEMAMADAGTVTRLLSSIPGYVAAFEAAFPGQPTPISYDNAGRAVGAFERGLVTPSRWDRYLDGDRTALTALEVKGLKVFSDVGCVTCHTGELIGGSMFQKAGFVKPWTNQTDQGRFEVTGLDADRMMFKVPSLRNVAMTAPYFHDASVKTLDAAVRTMADHQIEGTLDDDEVTSIVAWLGSLSGDLPTAYIAAPLLPTGG